MIKYALKCGACEHEFEGWFPDSVGYDKQAKSGLIQCPSCASANVGKAIMAPNIAVRNGEKKMPLTREQAKVQVRQMLREMRSQVEKTCEDVGKDFPDEARKIHHGEVEERGIYGEATKQDVEDLNEEGVEVTPIPWVRDDA